MQKRREMGIWFTILLGLAIGLFLDNVRAGMIIGIVIGLCTIGLVAGRKGKSEKGDDW